jgi:hypothetical protein
MEYRLASCYIKTTRINNIDNEIEKLHFACLWHYGIPIARRVFSKPRNLKTRTART